MRQAVQRGLPVVAVAFLLALLVSGCASWFGGHAVAPLPDAWHAGADVLPGDTVHASRTFHLPRAALVQGNLTWGLGVNTLELRAMAQSGEACDVDGADGAPSRFFVCGLGPGNVTVTASGSPLAPDHYDVDVTFKEILPEEYR